MLFRRKAVLLVVLIGCAVLVVLYQFSDREKVDVSSKEDSKSSILKQLAQDDRVLCIIMTTEGSFMSRSLPAWNIWAQKCDKALFACNCKNLTDEFALPFNKSNPRYKSEQEFENAKTVPILQLNVTEDYNLMSAKVFQILKLVYQFHLGDLKWAFLADDDTFTIVKNLKKFVARNDPTKALSYGYNFKMYVKGGYHSGGGGVLLTRESVKRLHYSILKGACKIKQDYGDVQLGICEEKSGIKLGISLDNLGRERFHPLPLKDHFIGFFPEWLHEYASNPVQKGYNCCSEESITFHYIGAEDMLKYSKFLEKDENFTKIFSLR